MPKNLPFGTSETREQFHWDGSIAETLDGKFVASIEFRGLRDEAEADRVLRWLHGLIKPLVEKQIVGTDIMPPWEKN